MKNKNVCSICGSLHEAEELQEFNGKFLCSGCLEANTVICRECGERIWSSENERDHSTPLCERCYTRYYMHCAHCGRLIRESEACYMDEDEDGDNPFCSVCYVRQRSERVIHDYYYKPAPQFCGEALTSSPYFRISLAMTIFWTSEVPS